MPGKNSIFVLLLVSIFGGCDSKSKEPISQNTEGIVTGSLADAAIDSTFLNKIDTAIINGTYPNIHSLLIVRHGKLVFEKYWAGFDESWGDNPGIRQHGKDSLHDIRSVSKSIVSACVGLALQQGKIKSIEQRVFEFFPEYARLDTGLISSLKIKHLLTMSSGLKWNEKVPYSHPENSEIRMDRSPDKIEYILSQPMDHTPGTVWNYNGGNTQLLAAIIEKTTGKRIDQFANEFLFQPLGIEKFEWAKYRRTDIPAAASGLRLRPRDMLKFGLLYNDNGKWGDKTILSPKWIESSFQSHMRYSETGGYGYQFWTWQDTIENKIIPFVYCDGNGDQKIIFDKTHDLLIISTAGNYNKWDIPNHVYALLKRFVFPAIKE